MKINLNEKTVLLILNVTTYDMFENENLKTSKIIRYVNFLNSIGVGKVILNPDLEFDYVVTQHEDNLKFENFRYNEKPAFIFHFDTLNGGMFYEDFYLFNGTEYVKENKKDIENVSFLNVSKIENILL